MTFFRRLFRCVHYPRYRLMGARPFSTFPEFRDAFETHYVGFDLRVHRSIPRDRHFAALARDDFFTRTWNGPTG